MLNHLKSLLSNLLFLSLLAGIAIILILTLNNPYIVQTTQDSKPTSAAVDNPMLKTPSTPTPTIFGRTPNYVGTPPTATPQLGEIRPEIEAQYTSTPTALPITDLAAGLSDENKMIYIVKRSDGTYEEFLLSVESLDNREQLMKLGPQDMIVGAQPLVPLPPSRNVSRTLRQL